jgi:hypothetical protein
MKLKLRYTKLPKPALPKFQMQGELQYDEYGNVINAPYLTGQAGINSQPFDNLSSSWEQGFPAAVNPGSGVTIGDTMPNLGFRTNFKVPTIQSPTAPVQINQNLSRNPKVANMLSSFDKARNNPAVQNFNQDAFQNTSMRFGPDDDLQAAMSYANKQAAELGIFNGKDRRELKGFIKDMNQQFGTNYKLNYMTPERAKLWNRTVKQAGAISTGADVLGALSTGVGFLDARNKRRQFDQSMRDRAFDITPTASPEFEGNYDVNSGMFQPYRTFNPNEGQFAEDGGQINTTMKIRITGTPTEQMAYGGQSNYGLDLGRKEVYTDMPEGRSESISSSMSAVPREMANIEAEGGETVYGDLDGDGGLEHMKIHGKRHTQGGVPLNVPEGSFVFSDTKKMRIKDPAILAKFGASYKKGGATPASIAKKYDINHYKAIMEDPNADPLDKATARIMVKNYQTKLGQLALVQEGMKGFPAGIPDVAQSVLPQVAFGGYLDQYQTGQQVRKTMTPAEIAAYEKAGYKRVPGTNEWRKENERVVLKDPKIIPGKPEKVIPGKGPETRQGIPGGTPGEPWRKFIIGELNRGVTYEELAEKGHGTIGGLKKQFPDQYKPAQPQVVEPAVPEQKICEDPNTKFNPETGKCEQIIKDSESMFLQEDPGTVPGGGGGTGGDTPYKFLQPDKYKMAAAAMFGPRLYMPWSPDLAYRPNQLALQDWQAQTQNIYQGVNTAANTLGAYQPGTAMASNLAFLQGQAANNAANAIYQTDAGNVDRFNRFSELEGARRGEIDLYNQENRRNLFDKGVIAKQQFDNSLRKYASNLGQAYADAWKNRSMWGALNATNQEYNMDPDTGRLYFTRRGRGLNGAPAMDGSGAGGFKTKKQLADWLASQNSDNSVTQDEIDKEAARLWQKQNDRSFTTSYDTDGDGIRDRGVTRYFQNMAGGTPSIMAAGGSPSMADVYGYLTGGHVYFPY